MLKLMAGAMLSALAAAASAQTVPSVTAAPHPSEWLQTGNATDAYWMSDNRWGQENPNAGIQPGSFSQGVGVSPTVGSQGEVAFRINWNWPMGNLNPDGSPVQEVKGYPALLSGRKPGYATSDNLVNGLPIILPNGTQSTALTGGATPGTFMPRQLPLSAISATVDFSHNTAPTGMGQLTFDIWLQSAPGQDGGGMGASSITHEIMIPLTNWGGYGAHPNGRNPNYYDHDATIAGKLFHVYITKDGDGCSRYNWPSPGALNGAYGRTGWKMIAFVPDQLPLTGTIDIAALVNYVSTRTDPCGSRWAQGNEYMASAELGVEPVVGTGDVTIYNYRFAGTTTPPPPPPCNYPPWDSTIRYMPGDIVSRNGQFYVATDASADPTWNVNSPPEWTPSLWAPYSGCSPPPPNQCQSYPAWDANTRYFPGNIVNRNGQFYVATDASADPTWNVNSPPEWTPSLWSPYTCPN